MSTKARAYDYIIVGAGSAGCVLAARLSEDPRVRVALVESGGRDRRSEVRIPAAFTALFKTPYDWDLRTAKQEALGGRELYWPRGHVLGGSSSLNAMMWIPGHRADYDAWGELAGEEWAYDAFVRYVRRAERWAGAGDPARTTAYGTDGPLHIAPLRDPHPATAAFLEACRGAGLPELPELSGPDHSGCAPTPVNQRRGRRWSAADGYLRPALKRPNLHVYTDTRVSRLHFDDTGTRVNGIVAERPGANTLLARREVVLSAGAVGSPHLLLRSGIGDPDALRAAGVRIRVASPEVGRHLQDHLATAITLRTTEPISLTGAKTLPNLLRYLLAGRGPLTSNIAEAMAFTRSTPELAAPDLELIFAPVPFVDHGLAPPTEHGLTIGVVLLQPESAGTLSLGADGAAVIDPGYLTSDGDLRTLVAGVRQAEALFAAPPLARLTADPMGEYPGVLDDAALGELIRATSQTLYHPVGTCRMGLDPYSVTDPRLRVRGVPGLRVVDASVMPRITRGHTHAPTVALAEKAAELIQEDAA
ncbi:GMC family oxidoreductase [Streptomyces sp. NPDC060194]|uniref:GMC family oxidoreductase n=1 Tax=Streptomyces sp. NPDC060194 TaxID=3347069 RepID=UPI00365CA060